jgi:hypothetical protein
MRQRSNLVVFTDNLNGAIGRFFNSKWVKSGFLMIVPIYAKVSINKKIMGKPKFSIQSNRESA